MDNLEKQQWNNFWDILKKNGYKKIPEDLDLVLSLDDFADVYQEIIGEKNWLHYYRQNCNSPNQLRDGILKYLKLSNK